MSEGPGRPSLYTPELATQICQLLSEGLSLREVCRREEMPGKSTVMRWLEANPEFRDQYALAREVQADQLFDEMLEIADDGTNDWVTRQNKDGTDYEAVDHDHINRSRLRVDTRKWILARMAPKKYGDRVTQEVTGPNGGPLVVSWLTAAE